MNELIAKIVSRLSEIVMIVVAILYVFHNIDSWNISINLIYGVIFGISLYVRVGIFCLTYECESEYDSDFLRVAFTTGSLIIAMFLLIIFTIGMANTGENTETTEIAELIF